AEGIESFELLLPEFSGPWHAATSLTLPPMADAISASERPDSVCNFTTLQSTWSVEIELHPDIPPARSNAPSAAAIPNLLNASAIEISPPESNSAPPQNPGMRTILLTGSLLQAA